MVVRVAAVDSSWCREYCGCFNSAKVHVQLRVSAFNTLVVWFLVQTLAEPDPDYYQTELSVCFLSITASEIIIFIPCFQEFCGVEVLFVGYLQL